MNRNLYTVATWLMWLALPLTAWSYWRVWDQLPMRMAVHFNANWQPNGYTSREAAVYLAVGVVAFLLVLFTVGSYAVRSNKPGSAWPVMLMFYVALTGLFLVNNWIAQYNLKAHMSPSALFRTQIPPQSKTQKRIAVQQHL